MSVAAVILAAGASRRLGRPKQSVMLQGEMLIERAVRIAREAQLAPVIVVVPSHADFLTTLEDADCVVVMNEFAASGMASSIRLGVQTIPPEASGVLIMTCDQPGVQPDHLQALCTEPAVITGSAYAGRIGVPAYFPASSFPISSFMDYLDMETGDVALIENNVI